MKPLRFTAHAFERLFERDISPLECEEALSHSQLVESYPDSKPFPAELRLGYVGKKALHLVIAETDDSVHVITAYIPDPALWSTDLARRQRKGE